MKKFSVDLAVKAGQLGSRIPVRDPGSGGQPVRLHSRSPGTFDKGTTHGKDDTGVSS